MSIRLKSMLRDFTPPIVRRVVRTVMAKERKADWYDKVFKESTEYDCHYIKSHYYFIWCVILDRVMRSGAQSVLDIGCGPGQVASFFQYKGLQRYFGLDLSTVAIEKARKLCPNYQFKVENALETDVLARVDYDTAISMEFLEHVTEELEVLKKLKPGTRFFGTVPDFPYPSHVRYFSSSDEVQQRYRSLFTTLDVDEFQAPNGTQRYFLLEGVKS
jgi:SAM-dependent methyltransferase